MGLTERSLEVLVGLQPPGPVTAELVLRGRPVGVPRQTIADWSTRGSAVAGTVTFGPMTSSVTFDAVRLYHGDEELADLIRPSSIQLTRGETFTESIRIDGSLA